VFRQVAATPAWCAPPTKMIRSTFVLRQAVDLVAVAQRLGPAARSELAALRKTVRACAAGLCLLVLPERLTSCPLSHGYRRRRAQHEDLKRQLENTPKEADPIDWAHYARAIRTPGVVDQFKTAYANLKYPTLDAKTALATIEESERKALQAAQEATKEAEAHLAKLQQQLKELAAAKSVDQLTVRFRHPEHLVHMRGVVWLTWLHSPFPDHGGRVNRSRRSSRPTRSGPRRSTRSSTSTSGCRHTCNCMAALVDILHTFVCNYKKVAVLYIRSRYSGKSRVCTNCGSHCHRRSGSW